MSETVTIWVPSAYGIQRVDGCYPEGRTFRKPMSFTRFIIPDEGLSWCRTEAQAREVAEGLRLKRIASLKKQLAKLEAMRPHTESSDAE